MINSAKTTFDLIAFCCYGIMISLMTESDIFEITQYQLNCGLIMGDNERFHRC